MYVRVETGQQELKQGNTEDEEQWYSSYRLGGAQVVLSRGQYQELRTTQEGGKRNYCNVDLADH